MKFAILAVAVALTLPLVLHGTVFSQDQTEYVVQVWKDGSATWTVRTVGINVSVDLFDFQSKVVSLVSAAKSVTGRDMVAVPDSFSMNFTYSGSYGVVEYAFRWENFSKLENTRIVIGDVFHVENFFSQLYGDGEIYISYPPECTVVTVTPQPYQRDDTHQTLWWVGTADFTNSSPNIVLEQRTTTLGFSEILQQNAVLITGLAAVASGSSVGFFLFRRQRRRRKEAADVSEIPSLGGMESGEEKIVKLLKSSGGSLCQSAIVDQCRFSKAKTSQLLAALEAKGLVSRYKKGRDKIVTLVERGRLGDAR